MASAFAKEGDMETESGLITGKEEMEELIFVEIRKLQDNRQRPKLTKICKALYKTHGLNEGVVQRSLNHMLKTGKYQLVREKDTS